jgi:hypothetical protein
MSEIQEKKEYASILEDEGIDYRMISQAMTEGGWKMNHTSARNYVLRVMRKFAFELSKCLGVKQTDTDLSEVASDARFQDAISEILQEIFYK